MRTLITYRTLLLKIVALILVKISHAVPPDYCLRNLNKSDCSVSPIHVFSYYKPGSRCELEVWRGCPSDNLFRTESACINTCIRRKGWNYEKGVTKFVSEEKLNEAKCHGPVDINKCNSNATRAFVYNKTTNECDEIIWSGCQHKGNVFEEQLDCLQTCYRGDLNWNDKINIIPNNLANELDTILDNISLDGKDTNIKLLLHKTVTKNDDHLTSKKVEDKLIETHITPTTNKHAQNHSISTVTNGNKIAEYTATKALYKTTESLNYSSTVKYLVPTNKTKYTTLTTPKYTLTPKTTSQTTIVESTTSEVITTRTESTSPETTTTIKLTTTTDDTTTKTSTSQATTPEAATTKVTTTEATTPIITTINVTTTEDTTTEATTTEATTTEATTTEATTTEATTPETTTTITTVEEKTTVKTDDTGTAKEVVLPQDMY